MSPVVRKSILVVALLLVASVFGYEQLVVKRQATRLQEELMELVNDTSHTYSEDAIRQLVNEPAEIVLDTPQKKVIKYSWRGLTWRTYDVFVVFRSFRGSTMITDASMEEPSPTKPFIKPGASTETAAAKSDGGPIYPPSNFEPKGGGG